jgi:hypothetical protein
MESPNVTKSLEERVAALELARSTDAYWSLPESLALAAFQEAIVLAVAARDANPAAFVRAFIACLDERVEAQKRPDLGPKFAAESAEEVERARMVAGVLVAALKRALQLRSVPPPPVC